MKKLKTTLRTVSNHVGLRSDVRVTHQNQVEPLKFDPEKLAILPSDIRKYIAELHFLIQELDRLDNIWQSLLARCEFQNFYHHSKRSSNYGAYNCKYDNSDIPNMTDITTLCFFRPQSLVWYKDEIICINITILYPPEKAEAHEGVSLVFNLDKHVETRTIMQSLSNTEKSELPPIAVCIGGIPRFPKNTNKRNLEKSKRVKVY